MQKLLSLLSGFILLALGACQTQEDIILVPDNTAPPDQSVPLVVQENYINRVYISQLGRKPTANEQQAGLAILQAGGMSADSRRQFVSAVLANPEFYDQMFEKARADMLNNTDTTEVRTQIDALELALTDPNLAPFYDLIQYEIDRLETLLRTPEDLKSDLIDRIGMHRRFVDNSIYDQINMGSLNFVLAMFEYFLKRIPTVSEEERAVAMVDGFYAVLFGKEGGSKEEYLDIFFDSDDYFEGQVLNLYNDLLFRVPSSTEMVAGTEIYRQSGDYRELLTSILITDEFLGI